MLRRLLSSLRLRPYWLGHQGSYHASKVLGLQPLDHKLPYHYFPISTLVNMSHNRFVYNMLMDKRIKLIYFNFFFLDTKL
jgi:hypothetical protein